MKAKLPVGLQNFHKNRFFNLQMNRWYSLGYTRLEDLQKAASGIKTSDDYTRAFVRLAEEAVAEQRLENAAFYYRAAEFLTNPSHPDKIPLYDKVVELFHEAFRADNWEFFADAGYEVIAFDGPGQGGAHRKYGLPFNHDWEKPVKAVLDYFDLADVTILGISMGGYWCLRAAAFEKRIRRVISFPPLYDWMESTNAFNKSLVNVMMKWEWLMNSSIRLKMKAPLMEHVINQTLFITNKENPIEVVRWELAMNKEHLHSELVDQDVLLLAGEKDFFQPVKLYHKQMKALTNAKSVTGRVFTEADQAENHCGIGNIRLPLEVMLKWLEEKG